MKRAAVDSGSFYIIGMNTVGKKIFLEKDYGMRNISDSIWQ